MAEGCHSGKRRDWMLVLVAALGGFLALGGFNPLYLAAVRLGAPGLVHFRAPARFLVLYVLAVSLLAGTGLDGAGQDPASRLALAGDRGGLSCGGVALRGGVDAVGRCNSATRLHRSAPGDGPSARGHAGGGGGERRAGGPVSQHVAGALRSGGSDRDPPNLRRGADARMGRLG